MMIQAIRLTRKKAALAVIAAGVLIAALILLLGRGGEPAAQQPLLTGNAERVAYLQSLPYNFCFRRSSRAITLPITPCSAHRALT